MGIVFGHWPSVKIPFCRILSPQKDMGSIETNISRDIDQGAWCKYFTSVLLVVPTIYCRQYYIPMHSSATLPDIY